MVNFELLITVWLKTQTIKDFTFENIEFNDSSMLYMRNVLNSLKYRNKLRSKDFDKPDDIIYLKKI
jgi:hypothetical protein